MLRIGPSGNSVTFYSTGHKHTIEAPEWLHSIGLNAYEYSFGRGITLKEDTAKRYEHENKIGIRNFRELNDFIIGDCDKIGLAEVRFP